MWQAAQQLTSAPLSAVELANQWEAAALPRKQIYASSSPARKTSPHAAHVQPTEAALIPSMPQGQLNTLHILRCIRSFAKPGADAGFRCAIMSTNDLLVGSGRVGVN